MANDTFSTFALTDPENSAYKTFTGADIVCYIGNRRVGTIQAITVSVTREVQPIYVLGSPEAKAFAKGKRGIAGSLVFSQFDRDALTQDVFLEWSQSLGKQNLEGLWTKMGTTTDLMTTDMALSRLMGGTGLDSIKKAISDDLAETRSLVGSRRLEYADQIPPFNITVTMVNEEGASAVASILGIQLINQGFGWSLDDITNEVAYTFLARRVLPLTSLMAYSSDGIGTRLSWPTRGSGYNS